MDRKMSGSSSRKGSRDAGGTMGSGDDTRVVREGDKVYVITEYSLQEEEEQEQPRSLCLVSLCWMLRAHVHKMFCCLCTTCIF